MNKFGYFLTGAIAGAAGLVATALLYDRYGPQTCPPCTGDGFVGDPIPASTDMPANEPMGEDTPLAGGAAPVEDQIIFEDEAAFEPETDDGSGGIEPDTKL